MKMGMSALLFEAGWLVDLFRSLFLAVISEGEEKIGSDPIKG